MTAVPYHQGVNFPLEGDWREVTPQEVDAVINRQKESPDLGKPFMIEGIVENYEDGTGGETAWVYLKNGIMTCVPSDNIEFEDLISSYVDATNSITTESGVTVYTTSAEPDFRAYRFFLPAT